MLIFVDETWQQINGIEIGALAAVASEFTDSKIKGQTCFAKAAFKRHAAHGDSYWLRAADQLFSALVKHKASAFVIWTKNPAHLNLRNPSSTALGKPYKQLLFDLRAFMRHEANGRLASINFDERAHREDEATARAVSNFLIRTSGPTYNRWDRHFLTTPSFTASSISPGLQAADLVSYLGAHRGDPAARPELQPFAQRLLELRYEYQRTPKARVRCLREVV